MKIITSTIVALGTALATPTFAQTPPTDHSAHHGGAQAQSVALSEGEVRKVDKEAGKITIRHGPLKNLDMPAMTMVFQVKQPEMLDKVKAGDKVKFDAQKIDGAFTVVRIELAE